jgi:MFS family permease
LETPDRLTRPERRATIGLATLFGLRMLGMFLILPVFALYAAHIPGGDNHALIGIALGAYGLSQALLQLPFGMLSDRFGRKRMILLGLGVFALGSFIAAWAPSIYWVIVGRIVQGAGAISAAVTALLADSTREEIRTRAMAGIGATIGIAFAVSLVLGPVLARFIGVSGIFALTGFLALMGMLVVRYYIPDPLHTHFHSDAQSNPARLGEVLKHSGLLRLNYGIFALHAAQMAMFVVVPVMLSRDLGLASAHHWWLYLPVLVLSFAVMVPAIIYGETRDRLKPVFVGAVALMLLAQMALAVAAGTSLWGVGLALLLYFAAFNILEASLPSLVSKMAPAAAKGTAIGVYNTAQSLGLFIGGAAGGWLAEHHGFPAVFVFCLLLMAGWLVLAAGMRTPPAVRTRLYHVELADASQADRLRHALQALGGVQEVSVLPAEGAVMLKVARAGWDEAAALELIQGKTHGLAK